MNQFLAFCAVNFCVLASSHLTQAQQQIGFDSVDGPICTGPIGPGPCAAVERWMRGHNVCDGPLGFGNCDDIARWASRQGGGGDFPPQPDLRRAPSPSPRFNPAPSPDFRSAPPSGPRLNPVPREAATNDGQMVTTREEPCGLMFKPGVIIRKPTGPSAGRDANC